MKVLFLSVVYTGFVDLFCQLALVFFIIIYRLSMVGHGDFFQKTKIPNDSVDAICTMFRYPFK